MPEQYCLIWGSSAQVATGDRAGELVVQSLRAAGNYRVAPEAAPDLMGLSQKTKAKLTTWLIEQRRAGEATPEVTSAAIQAAENRSMLRLSERRTRILLGIAEARDVPVNSIAVRYEPLVGNFNWREYLSAWGECPTESELTPLMNLLCDEGLLALSSDIYRVTAAGFDRIEAMENGGANTRQAFVAMWFDPSMNEAWRRGFQPGIRDAGYEPFRIDELHHNRKIDDEIVAQIKRSRFLIADFTCGGGKVKGHFQPDSRGGVYYEAGLAHGLNMDVIFTCRADRLQYAHFDTNHFNHVVWKTPDELREGLYNRIAATLKEAPGAPGRGKGFVDPPSQPQPSRPVLV